MTDNQYPFEATADLPGISYTAMRQMILMQAQSSNLKVLEDLEQRLTVETAHGLIGLRAGQTAEAAGFVGASNEHWLFVMKNAVVAQMNHAMPEVAAQMRWSVGPEVGSLPPNFNFVEVIDVAELGPAFFRVTFRGEDLSQHQDASIHFRLVIPPVDVAPQWPGVAANGSVVWPEGEAAPHRPVYTTRSIDHATNTLVMDVFVHEGGRVTDWARRHLGKPGASRVVGIMGPSGGGLLHADKVLMASDETGFPAAARLLENLPEGATGHVFLEAEHGADCAYPITPPAGVTCTWLSRANGDELGACTLAALPDHPDTTVWFAGERGQARKVREAALAQGWEKANLRVSGFWVNA
ncbi:MAG: siderophore-interacting protein [Pseudomonadota bacterium]